MSLITTLAYAVHGLAAGTWVGAVILATWKVLPLAREGDLDPAYLRGITSGLTWLTRTNSLVMPATGLWMAWDVYAQFTGLLVPPRGHTVLTMIVLWLVMTGLIEYGTARIRGALDDEKVRTAGQAATTPMRVASLIGLLLLALGGYLAGPGF